MSIILANLPFLDSDIKIFTISKNNNGEWKPLDFDQYNDLVSYVIRNDGWWEPDQTELFLGVIKMFKKYEPTFLDIGSHLGYYSIIAAHKNIYSIAFDINKTFADIFDQTVSICKLDNLISINLKEFDQELAPEGKLIIKIDIEGSEIKPLKYLDERFKNKDVCAAFVEITPSNENKEEYIEMLERMKLYGYLVSDIGNSPRRSFLSLKDADLNNLKFIQVSNFRGMINNLVFHKTQTNILFLNLE